MKKTVSLSVYITVLVLSSIFACGKDETIKSRVTPVAGSTLNPVTDTMPAADTIPVADTSPATDTTTVPSVGAKFLALGDSYTIGQNVEENGRFPAQAVQLLQARNIHVNSPQYIAKTGWTTDNLMYAINVQKPPADFDIVTLLIGVNDQYQMEDTTGYGPRFEQLLKKAVYFARGKKSHVFVLSIPDYSVTPFVSAAEKEKVSRQVDEFNAINKKITLANHATYIDITPSTRQAANDLSFIADDGLHPSAKEYKKWAQMLAPLMEKVLK
jgi:lysophospholipase L1-like esterase